MRLSRTRSSVSRLSSCGTTPSSERISGPCESGSRPRTVRSPAVRCDTAPTIRMVVDLPAPLGPSRPNDSPGGTSKSMPSTAVKSPKRLVRPWAAMTGAVTAVQPRREDRQRPSTIRLTGAAPPGSLHRWTTSGPSQPCVSAAETSSCGTWTTRTSTRSPGWPPTASTPPTRCRSPCPWTRGTPIEVARSVLAYQWGARASASPEKWNLELAVVRDGEVLGTQSLTAHDFPVTRTAETGSWLGLRHHGQGDRHPDAPDDPAPASSRGSTACGRRPARSTTAPASLGVTRRIGYAENGVDVLAREGRPAASHRFVLDRATWDGRPAELRPEVDARRDRRGTGAARHLTRVVSVPAPTVAAPPPTGSAVAEVP